MWLSKLRTGAYERILLVTTAVDVKVLEKMCVDNRVLVSVMVISSWVTVIVIAWK